MLTYATIFIGSIILAVIALVVYRVITESGKSVLNSREPISIVHVSDPQKGAAPFTTTGVSAPTAQTSHATPANMAKTHPAKPTENIDWGWKVGTNQDGTGTGAKHCSLYGDTDNAAPAKRSAVWPHREEKTEVGGTAYKVRRKKAVPKVEDTDNTGKPWGW